MHSSDSVSMTKYATCFTLYEAAAHDQLSKPSTTITTATTATRDAVVAYSIYANTVTIQACAAQTSQFNITVSTNLIRSNSTT